MDAGSRKYHTLTRLMVALAAQAGLLSVPSAANEQPRFAVTSFIVEGDNPIPEGDTRRLLAPFLSADAGLTSLQEAADALEDELRRRGYGFIQVSLPEQALGEGAVRLRLVPFTIGSVKVTDNRYFSEQNIRGSMPVLQLGTTPNTRDISRNLAAANAHPAKKLQVTFAAAETAGQIDARIKVQDRPARQFYAWLNNTGSEETGDTRLGFGYQHGNLFNRDHALTMSYTTSPDKLDEVRQYGIQYQVPFYRHGGVVNLFAAYSDVATGTVAEFFDVSGKGSVVGIRYSHLFAARGTYNQRLEFGVTDKLFDNEVDFLGEPLGVDVRSRPLSLRYLGQWEGSRSQVSFHVGAASNLEGGSENDDAAYAASRSGADADWIVLQYGLDARTTLRGWLLNARLAGQHTDEPLIAGEQFGLGGAGSVRGFGEREVTGDRGYQWSLEAWSPRIAKTGIRALAFVEGGYTELLDSLPGEVASENLSSAGVGLAWTWRRRLSLRLDWGYVLNGADQARDGATDEGDNKLHFNLSYRF